MNSNETPTDIIYQAEHLFDFFHTMPGEDFLLLYAVWGLFLWAVVFFLRTHNLDKPITTITGLVLFEGVGLLRYFIGSAHGMHRWGFMIAMMLVGGLFFLLRAEHFNNNGGSGNCSSGCSSSGCGGASSCGGGGGCGGGGCGGCGGS